MARAQCIAYRGDRLILAKHRRNGEEWWCLPGGKRYSLVLNGFQGEDLSARCHFGNIYGRETTIWRTKELFFKKLDLETERGPMANDIPPWDAFDINRFE
jgi:hypothetical protein